MIPRCTSHPKCRWSEIASGCENLEFGDATREESYVGCYLGIAPKDRHWKRIEPNLVRNGKPEDGWKLCNDHYAELSARYFFWVMKQND